MHEAVRGQRPAAPEPARLVQEFVNTTWRRTGEETWTGPGELRRWLVDRALLPPGTAVTQDDLALAVRVREALRDLLTRNRPAGAPSVLRNLPLRPTADHSGRLGLEPAGTGTKAALARVLVAGFEGTRTGDWDRLKVCAAPDCRWVFYDPSRNRSAVWCNMAVCGSRAKSNTYYRRHRQANQAQY
jgi:predicted RNA-binding Zn ribbon-like protein